MRPKEGTMKAKRAGAGIAGKRDLEVMTPEHPRWHEFTQRLAAGLEVCGGDQAVARLTLGAMGGFDVERSLELMTEHGGTCDCEILLNVEHDWQVRGSH
jgi:hypothetical protein